MKKLIIRALAGLLASVVLVACVSLMGNMPGGKRTDGIFYEASGIHPDATLMTVNKQPVTAEEFLYWLAYDCDYLSSYMGGNVDFSTAGRQYDLRPVCPGGCPADGDPLRRGAQLGPEGGH